jgi:phosphoglycolate phosphatase
MEKVERQNRLGEFLGKRTWPVAFCPSYGFCRQCRPVPGQSSREQHSGGRISSGRRSGGPQRTGEYFFGVNWFDRHIRGCRPPEVLAGRPRLLLFDFDGTIADTFDVAFEILNTLALEFGFRPLKPEELEKARNMRTREVMKFLKIPMSKMTGIARRGSEEIYARMPGIEPLPGMPEILRALHAAGYELGIVTSNSETNVNLFLAKHDLDLFSFIRSSSKLLGKARELRAVIKTRKVRAAEILFIGDETRDIEAAQKVGIPIAAVSWGYNSRRSLEEMHPDFLFDSAEGLVAHLTGLPRN